MVFGFWDVSMNPKTNLIYFWKHQMNPNCSRKIPTHFWKIVSLEISKSGNSNILTTLEKTGLKDPEDPSNKFLKS